LFLAFQTQRIPTDAAGAAASGAQSISDLIRGAAPTVGAPASLYLERALINPAGADPGHEAVVIGNTATSPQSLHGWQLLDRNGRSTKLEGDVAGGASTVVALDGQGAQLGNNGGNIVLLDDQGNQVDSVTYAAADAAQEARYVRFQP
jgi:hypothetical protein